MYSLYPRVPLYLHGLILIMSWISKYPVNTLRPRQNGRHFPDDILKWIFLNENVWISIEISLKFVPKGQINNIPALVQKMAWRRPGDKPLSEPMMVSLLTHMCVTRPQWVKSRMKSFIHSVGVWKLIIFFPPHFMLDAIIYPCWDLS